jgi:hypothetical protein
MPALLAALALVLAAHATPPTVTLVLCDVGGRSRFDGPALRREVETLLSGAGLVVRWREVQAGTGFDSHPDEMLVVLLPSEMRNPARERVLGLVIGDHRFPSPIWVSVPNVRFLLGVSPTDEGRAGVLSTALGRVIAHEVVHAFVPDRPHDPGGLMGRAVNRSQLTSGDGRLDEACLQAVARALADPELRRHVSGPPVAALTAEP